MLGQNLEMIKHNCDVLYMLFVALTYRAAELLLYIWQGCFKPRLDSFGKNIEILNSF